MPERDMNLTKKDKTRAPQTRNVGFLLIPGFALMSYASAAEPLRAANRVSERPLYAWRHISLDGKAVAASNGASILADHAVGADLDLDILFVFAGGNPALFRHAPTLRWLRNLARKGVRIGGVSGGPYILARAGLLSGYRCSVHWEHVPAFTEEFPDLTVSRNLFEIDRDRATCAGGVAALDMMHDLIAADHGQTIAAAVSDWFLHSQIRQGSGPQRMNLQERYGVSHPGLLKVLAHMEANIEDVKSRAELASLAGVSTRQLGRLFQAHLGVTPREHYVNVRLDRARMLLRQSALPILELAVACGFVSASHFSRSYRSRFGHAPRAERERALRPSALRRRARAPLKRRRART